MARILLLHGHHRHAVGTTFGRQIEVDDLRELLLQDRHEHLVQCHTENRRLIRRTSGVGAVVDRILAVGDALDGEHREAIHLVVVAGVIAVGSFVGHLTRMDMSLEDDLGVRRHLQLGADRLDQLGARAAQQAGKGIFGQRIGHRRDRAENGRRIGTQRHRHRVRPILVLLAPLAEIQRTATVAQPAHDDLVAADDLLPVDAEVLPFLVRALGDSQAPGDQRRGVTRPAVLHRNLRQVDVVTFEDHFLAGRVLEYLGRHADDLLVDRQLAPGVLQPLRRLRLLEKGQ